MIRTILRFFGVGTINEDDCPSDMKYLLVGIGNMGAAYDDTRHNIGFDVLDQLSQTFEVSFKNDNLGDIASFKHKGRQFHLLKPSTYVNRSGKAVRHWMTKHKISIENVLIILDDLNLDLGTTRLKGKGADGGHNGLKDIQQVLGTSKYARLRIGIGRDFHKGQQVDYVLGKWSQEEKDKLRPIIKKAGEACLSFGSIGLSHTMNQFNKP